MKINVIILSLILGFIYTFALTTSNVNLYEKMARDQIIADIYSSELANKYTCDSVLKFSNGLISTNECKEKIPNINKICEDIAKKQIQSLQDENEAKKLIQILVTCPVSKMLGYNYSIVNGVPTIEKPLN